MTTSVAPKERINIVYRSLHEDTKIEKELPLKLLVLGDFGDFQKNLSLQDRDVINVNKRNFDDVMRNMGITLNLSFTVDGSGHSQCASFENIDDFSPDKLVNKLSHVEHLLKVRNALLMLKGPIGNIPEFRRELELLINNDERQNLLGLTPSTDLEE